MALAALYDIAAHPLLSEAYTKLKTDPERLQQQLTAELLLGLDTPVYAGDDADRIKIAIVRQINFQLVQAITPAIMRSVSNTHPGNTTQYRDRYLEPGAWRIVADVTGAETVGFEIPGAGV